jgi:dephospho-CoA kinase
MSIVVGLSGGIASGKTTTARFLEKEHQFVYMRYSLLMKQLLEEQGLTVNDANLLVIGQKLEEELGGHGVSDLLMRDYDPSKNYVIDGLRHISDYEYFKERFGDKFFLLYLDVPEQVRMERFTSRGDKRDISEKTFIERSRHIMEHQVPLLRQKASVIISNGSSLSLETQIRSLILNWLM